jgi:ribosome-interacting GTPase 1
MASLEERIQEIEDEIRRTPYNKATQRHLGKLKAKLARLRDDQATRQAAGRGGRRYAVPKAGHATVGLVGLPSVGKSTLLNALTDAGSRVGDYAFTTLDVIPGSLEYRGAKIQMLDMPGLIDGAARGRGRGREVLGVARTCDLMLLMVDVQDTNVALLAEELRKGGLRLNEPPPDVVLMRRPRGGVTVNATVQLTHLTEEEVAAMCREWGYVNADVVLREDVTLERLTDALAGNRTYASAFVVLNKVDLVPEDAVRAIQGRLAEWRVVPVSATTGVGLDDLKEAIYESLRFIRVYLRPQGGSADRSAPLVVPEGATVGDVCDAIHRDFRRRFRFANVWGPSAKFPGQTVGLRHVLQDEDEVTVVVRR